MPILKAIQANVPNCTYHVNVGLGYLVTTLCQYNINLNPIYQRDYVWTLEQKQKFVGAMLENHNAIPPLWFNWTSKEFSRDSAEVVDGKQRIQACLEWLDGKFDAICPCKETVHIAQLDEIDMRNIGMSCVFDWNFVDLTPKEVMKFYLRLNSGGTVHTKDDLEKVEKLIAGV
jgi:hypothetical protein